MANIAGSLIALIMTGILLLRFGLYGALIALSIYQSLTFFVTFALCYRLDWFKSAYFFGTFDKKIAKNLAKYTLMALCAAVCIPLTQVFIRQYLGETFGWNAAGYWEAMWRLSAAYLLLVTTTLGVYYLPKLSEIKEISLLKQEIVQGYKIILPTVILSALLMYWLRDFIISLLFTKEFLPVRSLFLGQLVGDVLKIGSWILAYLMLGKAMTKEFIITEILFAFSFYLLMRIMTNLLGLEGVSWAYALNYLVYWVTMAALIFKNLKEERLACLS